MEGNSMANVRTPRCGHCGNCSDIRACGITCGECPPFGTVSNCECTAWEIASGIYCCPKCKLAFPISLEHFRTYRSKAQQWKTEFENAHSELLSHLMRGKANNKLTPEEQEQYNKLSEFYDALDGVRRDNQISCTIEDRKRILRFITAFEAVK